MTIFHQAPVTEAAARADLVKNGFCEHGIKMFLKSSSFWGGNMRPSGNKCDACEQAAERRKLEHEDLIKRKQAVQTRMVINPPPFNQHDLSIT